MKKCLYIVLTLGIMLTLYILSSQTGDLSRQLSDKVADTLLIRSIENITKFSQKDTIELSIRKSAHIFLYVVLGVFVSLILYEIRRSNNDKRKTKNYRKKKHIRIITISMIICFLYACFDEIHQYFIPGREASVKDIGFDAVGFIIGIVIINYLIFKKNSKKKSLKKRAY